MTGGASSAACRTGRRSRAGPSRVAPPMPDPFDPAEFDAPPPSDPGADYRTLLDAMRKAGAEGVAQQVAALAQKIEQDRSEEHTSELQSLMRISYAVFCLKKKQHTCTYQRHSEQHKEMN